MTAVLVAVVLLLLLAVVAGAFAWQERNRTPEPMVIYGVEDALEYVYPRLSEPARDSVRKSDVRRILEWEVKYLQNPALRHDPAEPAVVGGINAARYAQEELHRAGHSYDGDLILEVLELQAQYLSEIGAVAGPVAGDEGKTVMKQSGELGSDE